MPSIYQPRRPRASPLWQLLTATWETFLANYEKKHRPTLGPLRPNVFTTIRNFLRCGDLASGFLRFHCSDCGHERLLAFTCKGRHRYPPGNLPHPPQSPRWQTRCHCRRPHLRRLSHLPPPPPRPRRRRPLHSGWPLPLYARRRTQPCHRTLSSPFPSRPARWQTHQPQPPSRPPFLETFRLQHPRRRRKTRSLPRHRRPQTPRQIPPPPPLLPPENHLERNHPNRHQRWRATAGSACQRNAKARPKHSPSVDPWYPAFSLLWHAAYGEAALPPGKQTVRYYGLYSNKTRGQTSLIPDRIIRPPKTDLPQATQFMGTDKMQS